MFKVQGFGCQCTAQPLAAEAASLIEKNYEKTNIE
jgi:hypothetical protein